MLRKMLHMHPGTHHMCMRLPCEVAFHTPCRLVLFPFCMFDKLVVVLICDQYLKCLFKYLSSVFLVALRTDCE